MICYCCRLSTMITQLNGFSLLLFFTAINICVRAQHNNVTNTSTTDVIDNKCVIIDDISISSFNKYALPSMEGKRKGEAGKIGVIGGSIEYSGAPYFAAISALKVGADLAFVITTDSAAPIIKSYSPDLIVYPFLHNNHKNDIMPLLNKMDVVVIGPGLGQNNEIVSLIQDIISYCKTLLKPLVIDAGGLYTLSKNVSILKDYPNPGAILTPNHLEATFLKKSILETLGHNISVPVFGSSVNMYCAWCDYWGENVSVLIKGQVDTFHCNDTDLHWELSGRGSGRRAGGQGDILAGALGTYFNWGLKIDMCETEINREEIARSLATYAAAMFTRECNNIAFKMYGRSLTASDMIHEIHNTVQSMSKF